MAVMGLLDPVKGFGLTFATMFTKAATEQYPEEVKIPAKGFHGRHQLNRHPDGLEKCVGCELCAWACPAARITRSITFGASGAGCVSRPARPGH